MRGYPPLAKISKDAKDLAVAARLFDESERLTGVSFALTAGPRLASCSIETVEPDADRHKVDLALGLFCYSRKELI